jgi:hypothetical protein
MMFQTPTPKTRDDAAHAFPRVALPGVDRDAVDELHDEMDFSRKMRMGFILTFIRQGRVPFQGVSGNERKARRATGKRQRAGRRATR